MSQINRSAPIRASVSRRALPWPVRRLDAVDLIAQTAEQTGIRLELLGRTPGGQISAAYVRTEDGRDGVLTWIGNRSPGLVHFDFHPGHVLVDDTGDITGVVDWDAVSGGDRRFEFVNLRSARVDGRRGGDHTVAPGFSGRPTVR